ncbi:MAG: methyltransferase, partial [Proteobacteria bacterium]|nr:methyltransferase [Pseudomonadota bacterium]
MSETGVVSKRRGGRQARRELRAAPPPPEARPVKPGMEGGLYRPLADADLERVNQAALDMIEQV